MATTIPLRRFLVRRNSSDVFIWTEQLAKRDDLEEVWAEDGKQALTKEAMPDPRKLTLNQLEAMSHTDLLLFSDIKMGLKLDQNQSKEDLLTQIKLELLSRPSTPGVGPAASETKSFPDAAAIRGKVGIDAKVVGTHESLGPDQPVRR